MARHLRYTHRVILESADRDSFMVTPLSVQPDSLTATSLSFPLAKGSHHCKQPGRSRNGVYLLRATEFETEGSLVRSAVPQHLHHKSPSYGRNKMMTFFCLSHSVNRVCCWLRNLAPSSVDVEEVTVVFKMHCPCQWFYTLTDPEWFRTKIHLLQMIKTTKEIVAPVPGGKVIAKGELVTVIRTPKGTYIKLIDGKIFAVRSKRDAENFGKQLRSFSLSESR